MKLAKYILAAALGFSGANLAVAEEGKGASGNHGINQGPNQNRHGKFRGQGKKGKRGKNQKFKKGRGGRHGQGMLGKFKQVWKRLDLNEKQRDQLFALQQEHRKEVFENELAHEKANYDLHKALGREKLDDSEIDTGVENVAGSFRKGLESRINFVKKMREILTPEQASKLHKHMAKWHENNPPRPPRH